MARSCAKKNCGDGQAHVLAGAHQLDLHAARQLARTQPREGDAVAMVGVHVRLNLNTKALILGSSASTLRLSASCARGRRRVAPETFQKIADSEVAQRRTEEHRRQMAFAERIELERLAGFRYQRQFFLDSAGVEIGIAPGQILDRNLFGLTRLAPPPSSRRTPPVAMS